MNIQLISQGKKFPYLLKQMKLTFIKHKISPKYKNNNINLLSLALSLRTTKFNIQKFYMALALRWAFCTDIRTDSDYCFININWLAFRTVLESVYCAVQTDFLYKADYVLSLKG